MIVLLALQGVPGPPPPPPPPPPVEIFAPDAYVATCTVRAAGSDEPFAVTLSAKGQGKGRKAEVRSSRSDLAPAGRGKTRGVRRYERDRHSEYLSVGKGRQAMTVYHQWYGTGAVTSKVEFVRVALNEPVVIRARGTCNLMRNQR